MKTVYFSLANETHAKIFFVNILIARNCIIPSFSFKKSLRSDPQDSDGWEPCVFIIPYFTKTPLLLYLWLRSWNSEPSWRRLKLRPRYPGAPHDYSFYTHTCTHHILVFDFGLDIQRCAFSDLVSLTNRIYSSLASPLILRRLAPSSLASPTNRINHRLLDIRF